MPHSYQKSGSDASLWKSYEDSPNGEKHVHSSAIQDKLNCTRELKDAIKFGSLAGDLTSYQGAMESWCKEHQAKLETMGVGKVMAAVRRESPSIQVIVLAYFVMSVGTAAYGWTRADRVKLFSQYPMLEVYNKLVKMGMGGKFMEDLLGAVMYFNNLPLQLTAG